MACPRPSGSIPAFSYSSAMAEPSLEAAWLARWNVWVAWAITKAVMNTVRVRIGPVKPSVLIPWKSLPNRGDTRGRMRNTPTGTATSAATKAQNIDDSHFLGGCTQPLPTPDRPVVAHAPCVRRERPPTTDRMVRATPTRWSTVDEGKADGRAGPKGTESVLCAPRTLSTWDVCWVSGCSSAWRSRWWSARRASRPAPGPGRLRHHRRRPLPRPRRRPCPGRHRARGRPAHRWSVRSSSRGCRPTNGSLR